MVQAVDYAVRDAAGAVVHGRVGGRGDPLIRLGADEALSLDVAASQVARYAREGGNLVVTLVDGREIIIAGFFEAPAGLENALYLSGGGTTAEVDLTEGAQGGLLPEYRAAEGLASAPTPVPVGPEPLNAMASGGAETTGMAPFVPGLLAGWGGNGLLAAGAIAGGAAVVGSTGGGGGGGGGGGSGRAQPSVDSPAATTTLTTATTDPRIMVTGTGEPGDRVAVTLGGVTATATIDDLGRWSVSIPGAGLPPDGTHEAVVVVTPPAATGLSPVTLDGPAWIIDMTPPQVAATQGTQRAGHVETAADHANGVTLGGTGEPGAAIRVEVAGAVQTTTVGAQGTWSVTFLPAQVAGGDYSVPVTVTATDALGNRTTVTETLVIDTVANPVALNPVTPDNTVNAVEASGGFAITGTTAPWATVGVTVGPVSQSVRAGANGTWVMYVAGGQLPPGEYDATVTASTVDAAGNRTSATQVMRIDTTTDVTVAGPVAGNDVVTAAEAAAGVVLTGTAQPGAAVSVAWGGTTLPASVTAGGAWSVIFPSASVPTGERTTSVTVTATDAAGNTATATRPVRVDLDTQVTINARQAGGDNIVSGAEQQAGVALTGRAEAGASVAVTLEGVTRMVTAGSDGAWTATFARAEIPQGSYTTTVTVSATDAAGNVATASHPLAIDTAVTDLARTGWSAGADTVVNGAEAAQGLALRGTVEPGATVSVRFGSGPARAAQVAADGTWTVTVPAAEIPAGESTVPLVVKATDRVGNVATMTEQISIDTSVRSFARSGGAIGGDGVLNADEAAQGLPLSGTAEAGSTVVVRLSNGAEKSAVAGASGVWSLTFAAPDLPQGDGTVTAQLTATDRAGNTATLSETFRVDTAGPGMPEIIGFSRGPLGLRAIDVETTDDAYGFFRVDASGGAAPITATRSDDATAGETNFRFASAVPDGSYLVVNTGDGAGNTSSTLLVVDNTSAATVDLGRAGLAGFDLAAIDLSFAPEASLTITEAQLQALTGADQRLVVKGGGDDTVTLAGGVATGQTADIDGERFAIYTLGPSGAAVLLDDDIRVVI